MIDIENEVFNAVYEDLTAKFKDISVTSDYIAMPSEFPCVSVYEADNASYDKTQDSGSNENHVKVMYEVYVFSNKKSGRKSECKTLFNAVDAKLLSLGFTRIAKQPFPRDDGTIYQLIGRYEAVVSKNKTIFRR